MKVCFRIGMILIGIGLVILGSYVFFYRQLSFAKKELIINVTALQPLSDRFPAIFPTLVIVAGLLIIILELLDKNRKS